MPSANDGVSSLLPLEVDGLGYTGADGVPRLSGVSFKLEAGSRTVVMGPNGAGKSLLLRLLHGLIAPTAGRISWAGRALTPELTRRQALVFQRPVLLRRSVADNIAFVLADMTATRRSAAVDRALDAARLTDRARQPARLLSGGEQQRLALARALVRQPALLLLDEPCASLDPASTLAVEQMIDAAHAAGTKILLVTHNIAQARRLADDIVFLDRGRVAETGNAKDFLAKPRSEAGRAYLDGRLLF
jgi:tungstate transport system ATP-binding protein